MSLAHLTDLPAIPEDLRLRCRIGNGAAGHCFLVTDVTDQALALKVVSAEWAACESGSIRAFRKIPAHPALAQIYGAGNLPDGRFYYTMELADNAGNDGLYRADTLAYRLKPGLISVFAPIIAEGMIVAVSAIWTFSPTNTPSLRR